MKLELVSNLNDQLLTKVVERSVSQNRKCVLYLLVDFKTRTVYESV